MLLSETPPCVVDLTAACVDGGTIGYSSGYFDNSAAEASSVVYATRFQILTLEIKNEVLAFRGAIVDDGNACVRGQSDGPRGL